MRGRAFLNSCRMYIRLCPEQFDGEAEQVLWAISFMKEGRAAKWADQIFRWEEKHPGKTKYTYWDRFVTDFKLQFFPVNSEAMAINKLETTEYYQRNRTVEEYLDDFEELISDSGYSDDMTIVVKFRRGLRPNIQSAVATMTANRPSDRDPQAWYSAAKLIDQNRAANEAFQSTSRALPAPAPRNAIIPITRPSPTPTPVPPQPPRINAHSAPSPGNPVPMDIDRARRIGAPTPTCYRCGKTGHLRAECPMRPDIRSMSREDKQDLLLTLLAELDAKEENGPEPLERTSESDEELDFVSCSG